MSDYIGRSIATALMQHGSFRVVVNNAGETISGKQLNTQMTELMLTEGANGLQQLDTVAPHIMFVREDGWILAASPKFEKVAYNMWKDEWVGFVKCPDEFIEDIADYTPGPQDF